MSNSPKKVAIIGSGFSGLAASAIMASRGYDVCVYEKNKTTGGRARKFEKDGFVFDMGPSWYWMPDVIDRFFELFDTKTSDFFELKRLDPGFRVYFGEEEFIDIPDSKDQLFELFESLEEGSSKTLDKFLRESKVKYDVGVKDLVYKPSISITEFLSLPLAIKMLRLNALQSFEKYTAKYFKSEKIRSLMEFPILFLGGTAKTTPSLYSLMNYACFELGTWYPMGGYSKLADAMVEIAKNQGVEFKTGIDISGINVSSNQVRGLNANGDEFSANGIINGGDYQHFDQNVIDPEYRNYGKDYWDKQVMSPSSLIFYLGLDQKIDGLIHHNLFFDEDFGQHAHEIYKDPKWPSKPLFYVCCPSKTDAGVAPEGKENLFILMPLAVGIEDSEELREQYFKVILERLKKVIKIDIEPHIIYKKSYCLNDFKKDYYSFKGNAYGLANTTMQTAFMKPRMNSKKLANLFHCGQLTVPGPGVPPSIISGEVAALQLDKYLKSI